MTQIQVKGSISTISSGKKRIIKSHIRKIQPKTIKKPKINNTIDSNINNMFNHKDINIRIGAMVMDLSDSHFFSSDNF